MSFYAVSECTGTSGNRDALLDFNCQRMPLCIACSTVRFQMPDMPVWETLIQRLGLSYSMPWYTAADALLLLHPSCNLKSQVVDLDYTTIFIE